MATLSRLRKRVRSRAKEPLLQINPREVFKRGFIVLTACFDFIETPEHPLAIPAGWARKLEGDFECEDHDFCTRSMALGRCASENRAAMKSLDEGFALCSTDESNIGWSLVFEIGAIERGSNITLIGGCTADLHLDTCLNLVWPTADEIAESEVTHA